MVEAGFAQLLCGEVACNCDPQKDVEWMVTKMRVEILEDNERLIQKQSETIQKLLDAHEIGLRKAEAVHAMQLLKAEETHAAQLEEVKKANEKSYDRMIQTVESLIKELIQTVKSLLGELIQTVKSFARGLSSGNVYDYNWLWCALPQMLLCASIVYLSVSAPLRFKVAYGWFLQCLVSSACYYFIQLFNNAVSNSSTVAWILAAEVCVFTTLSSGVVWYICRIPVVVDVPTSVPAQGPATTTTATQSTASTVPIVPAVPTAAVVILGTPPMPTPVAADEPKLSYREIRERQMRLNKRS
jgi:hypothetical protein